MKEMEQRITLEKCIVYFIAAALYDKCSI